MRERKSRASRPGSTASIAEDAVYDAGVVREFDEFSGDELDFPSVRTCSYSSEVPIPRMALTECVASHNH